MNEDEKQKLDSEFRELRLFDFDNICENDETDLFRFWNAIFILKRGDASYVFPIITKFVRKVMVLPHSSTNVERVFSQVNLKKKSKFPQ